MSRDAKLVAQVEKPAAAAGDWTSLQSFRRLAKDQRAKFLDVVDRLFHLADANRSNTITFSEFLAYHVNFVERSNTRVALGHASMLPILDEAEAWQLFQTNDGDNDMVINREEFDRYVQGMVCILGVSTFQDVGNEIILDNEEYLERLGADYDAGQSSLLLDRVTSAHTLVDGPSLETCFNLLESKANPNVQDLVGASTLMYAAEKADAVLVARLLTSKADPLLRNHQFECAACKACRARNFGALLPLLMPETYLGASALEQMRADEDKHAASKALVHGMDRMDASQMRELLKAGADINYMDTNGWTPFTAAVFWNNRDCVEGMLRAGLQARAGTSKLHINMTNFHGRSALHVAARKSLPDLITQILGHGADPDLQDLLGWTPLHHAAFNGANEAVRVLLRAGAQNLLADRGLTPWMVSMLPSCASSLGDPVRELIGPPDVVKFSTRILPLLNNNDLTLYEKLNGLLTLPGVNYNPSCLRLHEQFFPSMGGPSKVRLQKFWTQLIEPLIRRLRTGETDIEPPGPHLSDEAQREIEIDIAARQKEQKDMLRRFLVDSGGPQPGAEWRHDNRGAYIDEMRQVVLEELESYSMIMAELYRGIQDADMGDVLCSLPAEEVRNPRYLSQLAAHGVPIWLETMSIAGAFEALRKTAAVPGMGGLDRESVLALIRLLSATGSTYRGDFSSGPNIWTNIYRLWLVSHAEVADKDFQAKIQSIVASHNADHADDQDLLAELLAAAPKTYNQVKRAERRFGEPSADSMGSRAVCAAVLDVVRCSITVDTAAAAVAVLETFKSLTLVEHKVEVARITNGFSNAADVGAAFGYRDIKIYVMFNGGPRQTACGRENLTTHMRIIGEVQVLIRSFLNIKKQRNLLWKWWRGEFDWDPVLDEVELEIGDDEELPLPRAMGESGDGAAV